MQPSLSRRPSWSQLPCPLLGHSQRLPSPQLPTPDPEPASSSRWIVGLPFWPLTVQSQASEQPHVWAGVQWGVLPSQGHRPE